ncbi:sugar ABC transporter substrate-binding protein [Saccharospirillum impatiens]|uniref:sugar ABC transporter substrate-binding protein n=1 Tax=Saccharospirillum impatiens TaxID=169438 RepID=UPI0009FC4F67|nr:sugar ABC transporter substrate-binding protein [Saccharospirillum impatiens]
MFSIDPIPTRRIFSVIPLIAGVFSIVTGSVNVHAESLIRIGITQNNVGVDSYQTTYESAFIEAASQRNDLDTVVMDAGGDVARQIAQMQYLIQQQVDAIIIWPTNGQAVVPVVRQAQEAGIPVVVTNSNIADEGQEYIESFSGPNNILQGEYSAEMMCDQLGGVGQVVQITGQPGYTTSIERQVGFEERLAEVCPDVELIESQAGDWNRERAQQVMNSFLNKYTSIDAVYSGDDNMGLGALNAAKAAGRSQDIKFFGATNFAVGYEAMERGEYHGSVYQSPAEDARNALRTALAAANGETVPKYNYFDTPKITQENMGNFEKPVF